MGFKIDTDFFHTDPDIWCENQYYLKAKKTVQCVSVANETTERGVKLIEDFNTSLTKDEEQ